MCGVIPLNGYRKDVTMGARPLPDDTDDAYDIYATHPTKTYTMKTNKNYKINFDVSSRSLNTTIDIILWIISIPFIIIIGITFLPTAILGYAIMGVVERTEKTLINLPILGRFIREIEYD
jgi:ABC-type bacteriocin/lantibiotic exporter with double-glycine peptidase domain